MSFAVKEELNKLAIIRHCFGAANLSVLTLSRLSIVSFLLCCLWADGLTFRDWHHGLTNEIALIHSPKIVSSDSSLSIWCQMCLLSV